MEVKYDKNYCKDCRYPKDCCFRDRRGKCTILLDAYNEDCGFAKAAQRRQTVPDASETTQIYIRRLALLLMHPGRTPNVNKIKK